MKKIGIVIFIAAIVLSSCDAPAASQETPSAPQVGGKTPQPVKTVEAASRLGVEAEALNGIEIEVWHPWYGVEENLFEALVEDFNSMNEWGIKIRVSGQVNYSYLYETVTASLPTASRPDVAVALSEHALGWDEDGFVVDLTPYVEDPAYGIDASDFPIVFWDQDKFGDRRVAVPAQRTARVMLWNESWANELGFDAAPEAADDFRRQACRAHQTMTLDDAPDNDGRGGWIIDAEPMTAFSWLLAFEGGVLEGNDYRFKTPNNMKALAFVKTLADDACAWQIPSAEDPFAAFASRQAMFVTAGLEDFPAVTRAFAAANNADKWTALAFPGDNQGALVVYGSSYVILKSSPEEQLAAWLFVRWMLEDERDARWVETTHLFPLRASTPGLLTAYEASHPQWAEAVDLLPEGELQPQLASWRVVKVMLGDGFASLFSGKFQDIIQPPEVLQKMEDIWEGLRD
jgi:ABC-type glycerol-3-phosphate transport system substrate-binding protein